MGLLGGRKVWGCGGFCRVRNEEAPRLSSQAGRFWCRPEGGSSRQLSTEGGSGRQVCALERTSESNMRLCHFYPKGEILHMRSLRVPAGGYEPPASAEPPLCAAKPPFTESLSDFVAAVAAVAV